MITESKGKEKYRRAGHHRTGRKDRKTFRELIQKFNGFSGERK